jgi:hypothetical protein
MDQRYRVTRFCCRSGLCIECMNQRPLRKRIVQADNLSLVMAKRYVKGWRDYEAKLEKQ